MKRYKLVRIIHGRFFSANTPKYGCLEYIVGKVTGTPYKGIACYKLLRYAKIFRIIDETMNSFNDGRPVAILEVKPVGKAIPKVDMRYAKDFCYEGGINYPSVCVTKVTAIIDKKKLLKMRR